MSAGTHHSVTVGCIFYFDLPIDSLTESVYLKVTSYTLMLVAVQVRNMDATEILNKGCVQTCCRLLEVCCCNSFCWGDEE